MKKSFSLFLFISITLWSCNKDDPYGGVYKMKTEKKYAVVIDSTVYIMCGFDSIFFYDMHIKQKIQLSDSMLFTIFHFNYNNSINKSGYENIDCPLKFNTNETNGGLPLLIFENNTSFLIGGYEFERMKDSAEYVFHKYSYLLTNNTQTILLNMSQNE